MPGHVVADGTWPPTEVGHKFQGLIAQHEGLDVSSSFNMCLNWCSCSPLVCTAGTHELLSGVLGQ